MPAIVIPLRIATTAWPSSWSRIDRKNSSALPSPARTRCRRSSRGAPLVVVRQPPDEQEQGKEPARIDADPDAEDPHERYRSATEHLLMVGLAALLSWRGAGRRGLPPSARRGLLSSRVDGSSHIAGCGRGRVTSARSRCAGPRRRAAFGPAVACSGAALRVKAGARAGPWSDRPARVRRARSRACLSVPGGGRRISTLAVQYQVRRHRQVVAGSVRVEVVQSAACARMRPCQPESRWAKAGRQFAMNVWRPTCAAPHVFSSDQFGGRCRASALGAGRGVWRSMMRRWSMPAGSVPKARPQSPPGVRRRRRRRRPGRRRAPAARPGA